MVINILIYIIFSHVLNTFIYHVGLRSPPILYALSLTNDSLTEYGHLLISLYLALAGTTALPLSCARSVPFLFRSISLGGDSIPDISHPAICYFSRFDTRANTSLTLIPTCAFSQTNLISQESGKIRLERN
jgi:hypothetical protein